MPAKSVQLIDQDHRVLATAKVSEKEGRFAGPIDLSATPRPLQQMFEEFEEIVNGQVFGLLDEIEAKISAMPVVAVFHDGRAAVVEDLQVFPSTGWVSFDLAKAAGRPLPKR